MFRRLLIYVFIFLALTSCKTNLVYISVMVPAQVTVPGEFKKAGIINRSIPGEQTKTLNNVHQVLSGQTMAIIKEGSAESVRGLKDALDEKQRFDELKIIDGIKLNSPGAGIFPAPLSWDELAAISRAHQVDVIFSLELFDTELKVNPQSAPDLSSAGNAINSVLTTDVSFTTKVKTGWRIYGVKSKQVYDETPFHESFTFTGNAVNSAATAELLIGRKETIKKTANDIGHDYAQRIIPYWLRVSRDYYVKGNSEFKKAMRMARTGNWDKAGEIWNHETHNKSGKLAGRACYNMAIISEINGDLDAAVKWAQKSYEDYGNKLALHYVRILNQRQNENRELEIQQ